jgi:hypothetical protein
MFTEDLNLKSDAREATITGGTKDGSLFWGTDTVNIILKKKK